MAVAAFSRFLVHDVELLTPTYVVGRYGDNTADWTQPPASTVAAKGWFTRVDTDEMADGREAITDVYELSVDMTTALTEDMRVVRLGNTYEIRGSVEVGSTPEGAHHQIVRLRRVVG